MSSPFGLKAMKRIAPSTGCEPEMTRVKVDALIVPGGVVLSFGWSSNGMGKTRGYEMFGILLVAHGGAHNDTIYLVERKAGQ